ncbi:hypothetical protein [Pseudoalteromonas sp. RB2-MNA-CIBAN-0110]|uniref:hypothetical protein n=1 Tax=Pseudoalteromonas sp. RB2-MNA-CIBAN-0110 TaxID=3140439 RepID=UPI00331F6398
MNDDIDFECELEMDSDFKLDRYFNRIYSSKLRISRRIIRMERTSALALHKFSKKLDLNNTEDLALSLEWFLTWKLKTKCAPEKLWCDGVEEISITKIDKSTFSINGFLWIGPESNINNIIKEKFVATLSLKSTGKNFKAYEFFINYNDYFLSVKKT